MATVLKRARMRTDCWRYQCRCCRLRGWQLLRGRGGIKHSRLAGACKHCKKLKMKCEFTLGDLRTCNRCKTSGYACIVEGRKPRNAPK
ncbi:hypothetical protein BKA70DRAFT_640949 [Coprinopsis sp. MPI-PUGE-AT-0042]|nr:hypothetical protein BKA70DRAFT_640949 [Coprinopsis sp. MPI-PUGE-AT-0042]